MEIPLADVIYESLDDVNRTLREFGMPPLKAAFVAEPEGSIKCLYDEELGFSLMDFTNLPTGTFKYIDSVIAGEWFLQNNGRKRIIVPSSGNTARAVCYWASKSGVEVEAVVTKNSWYKMEPELESRNVRFTQFEGDLDNARKYAEEIVKQRGYSYFAPNELKIASYTVIPKIIEKYERKTGIEIHTYSQTVSGGVAPAGVLLASPSLRVLVIQPDDLSPIVDAIEHNSPTILHGNHELSDHLIEPTLGTKRPSAYEKYLFPCGKDRILGERIGLEEIKHTWKKIREIFLRHGIMGDKIDRNFELEKSGVIAVAGTMKRKGESGIICAITGRGGKGFERPAQPDKVVEM